MRYSTYRMGLAAGLIFSLQGVCCAAQSESETAPAKIQPERISLSRSVRTISDVYVCIEPCNLLTQYTPKKTIFFAQAPDSVGSYDTSISTTTTYLTQAIQTTPLGSAELSEKAMGKDVRKYPGWIWKGLLITLGGTIIGYIVSAFLLPKGPTGFSKLQLTFILVPFVPFMVILLLFGLMSTVPVLTPDPLVNIYVDNATRSDYLILLNGEEVSLPATSHICLNVRPREHSLRIRNKRDGKEIQFAVSASFDETETYLINLEGANSYEAERRIYSTY